MRPAACSGNSRAFSVAIASAAITPSSVGLPAASARSNACRLESPIAALGKRLAEFLAGRLGHLGDQGVDVLRVSRAAARPILEGAPAQPMSPELKGFVNG